MKTWLIMVLYRCKVKIKTQHIIFPNNLKVMMLCYCLPHRKLEGKFDGWRWRICTWISCFWIKQQHRTRPYGCSSKGYNLIKKFSETGAKKLYELEKALIISQQTNPNSSIGNVGTADENCNCNGKSDFILNLLKSHITNLENEIWKTRSFTI